MSEMDKEAEREKLREQFKKEEEARKSTAHMSELLLKGATMTNKHCNNCGDPIFRYEGQHFCPTCRTPANADGSLAEMPAHSQAMPESGESASEAAPDEASDPEQTIETDTDAMSVPEEASPNSQATSSPTEPLKPAQPAPSPAAQGELSNARDSLTRTLNSLVQQAESTEDIRQTRELLCAAKDAAEALNAVNALTE